jgi:hypothetical protein
MKTWGNQTEHGLDPDFAAPAYIRIPQMAIVLAVQDACGKPSDRTQDAMQWIFGEGGNFEDFALLANWDADWLRRKVRQLLESGEPLKRTNRLMGRPRQGREEEDEFDEWETNDKAAPRALHGPTKRATDNQRPRA